MRLCAVATGIAKPTPLLPPPSDAIAVLMPMTFASASTRGPPELPGLIGASVWMRPVSVVLPIGSVRSRPLMMPDVTEAEKPNGLPKAIAVSPICTLSGSARSAVGRSLRGLHRDDREVVLGVAADYGAVERLAVGRLHGDRVSAGDDVVRGEDQAALVVDDAAADAAVVLDLDDRRARLASRPTAPTRACSVRMRQRWARRCRSCRRASRPRTHRRPRQHRRRHRHTRRARDGPASSWPARLWAVPAWR